MGRRHTRGGTVTVVGNGPVGQTTALLLARWGIPVTLLDARAERDPIGSKAICQQRDVLEVWDAIGVGRQLADEGVTWGCARTFHRDHELFAQTFVDRGISSFPPFVNISQARTEELLDERIAATSSIDVRWGYEATSVDQDETGVTITCRTGSGEETVTSDYAVVAVGSRGSAIRRQLGVTFDGRSFDDKFLICDIAADIPGWADERRFYFDPEWNPGRQVLIHPCPDSTFRIDWQVPGEYDLEAEEKSGALDARIRKIIGDTDYRIVWKSVYRFHSRVANRMRVDRVLLAGDAAHIVSPFGARGLNSGVADAENAAWKLAFVLRGWADESLLETYHTERHAAAVDNIAVTTATMDFLVPQSEDQHRHRHDVLTAAVTDPQARAHVDSGRLAEPFWYVESPLTTTDPERPFAGRPERGCTPAAAPGILVPDTPVTLRGGAGSRLRDIARHGILLLAGDGVDVDAIRSAALAAVHTPIRLVRLSEIDGTGVLTAALDAKPGEVWVIRPDAYIAAVTDTVDGLVSALHRITEPLVTVLTSVPAVPDPDRVGAAVAR
ncbi:FAD-dependent monooxygenase [Rhodococcus sp. IEGM 1307]|uniref:FAD-dependent monooxygenase n=1 Tax=Rhodococcus sp. IEGM 1307 TaxID=3047091 RepID=UPI0024B79505|nr:FAD-dependent monooxygenase [Rhodococcus sp. IEGM 1307]MDI9977486.1 FAD-dependent monooxygenase [Rhodococcus sp. IEGM 1307]